MKLSFLRISNFQSFGCEPTEIDFEKLTFLIGPNGSGKTAVLQALCRLFAFDPSLRRIQKSDFHVPSDERDTPEERVLWIEAEFVFPELLVDDGEHIAVPPHFRHMRLDDANGVPRIRYRLEAAMGIAGDIEDTLFYVLDLDDEGKPINKAQVPRAERNNIQVHYLPARRDPADHIAYTANALLGRTLRAVNWDTERSAIKGLTDQISNSLAMNISVTDLSSKLTGVWQDLHKGEFFKDPKITFVTSEIDALLRHMSVSFAPGHDEPLVDFARLSDGQKSMLYLSLVLSVQAVGRAVLQGGDVRFDPDKLRPAVFTIVAMEEPENSLSPHYLGRIVTALNKMVEHDDAQVLIATHAPSMLRRISPENIRYMRLNRERQTQISKIILPPNGHEAHKFVREAVQAFPELYFSRLVVLGEGDSEEIVLPRLLNARGITVDESTVSIVPLGGRHVNHFWRLLYGLKIPFITLVDMDMGRYNGGWGRVKYILDKLKEFSHKDTIASLPLSLPRWNDPNQSIRGQYEQKYQPTLDDLGIFFSSPLDIDFAMLQAFPSAFEISGMECIPDISDIKSVLGKNCIGHNQYYDEEKRLFVAYHKIFKLGSKPAAHINALSKLTDQELLDNMPDSLRRLVDAVQVKLMELPE